MRDDKARPRVSENETEAIRGVIGIERNVCRARLQQCEKRNIGFDAPVEENCDP